MGNSSFGQTIQDASLPEKKVFVRKFKSSLYDSNRRQLPLWDEFEADGQVENEEAVNMPASASVPKLFHSTRYQNELKVYSN
jgi:hypothetical protein